MGAKPDNPIELSAAFLKDLIALYAAEGKTWLEASKDCDPMVTLAAVTAMNFIRSFVAEHEASERRAGRSDAVTTSTVQ
jgi:hypothetical protein